MTTQLTPEVLAFIEQTEAEIKQLNIEIVAKDGEDVSELRMMVMGLRTQIAMLKRDGLTVDPEVED